MSKVEAPQVSNTRWEVSGCHLQEADGPADDPIDCIKGEWPEIWVPTHHHLEDDTTDDAETRPRQAIWGDSKNNAGTKGKAVHVRLVP